MESYQWISNRLAGLLLADYQPSFLLVWQNFHFMGEHGHDYCSPLSPIKDSTALRRTHTLVLIVDR